MGQFTLRHFYVDVTPPIGDYLCGGFHQTSIALETQLSLRGIVLSANDTHYVAACIDYCYLVGRSQARLEDALAAGAGIPAAQVALHSNHVHDAPLINEEMGEVMRDHVPGIHNEAYFADVIQRSRETVAAAMAQPGVEISSVSYAQHPVHQFASSRRVIDETGKCTVRWSVNNTQDVRDQPEGRIDPNVDQIIFHDRDNEPVACLNFYACHPQVSDGRRTISNDTVGIALDLFQKRHPDVFPLYFMGCGGDITAGKYTTFDRPRNRLVFGVRLYDGIQGAFEAAQPEPLRAVDWDTHVIELPLRAIPESEAHFVAQMREPDLATSHKCLAAMKLQRLWGGIDTYPYRLARLGLNDIDILFLPSEMVIDYQFYARARARGRLAVAAYGDGFLKYVAHDAAFDEGGYEVEPLWTEVDKGIQAPIRAAIDKILDKK